MGQLPDIEGIDMKIRYKRKDFEFISVSSVGERYALHMPLGHDIHVMIDRTRRGKPRPWEVIRKTDAGWSGMGDSRFKTPENAARAALEYWGF